MAATDSELVNLHIDGRIATVELNRPKRKNALIGPMADDLGNIIDGLNDNPSIAVVVIQGAGGAFCSGLDLKEFGADPQPDWVSHFPGKWRRVHERLFDCPHIVICALERYAINGGAALALAGDFLVVGDGAFLQVGEIQQGMPAPMNVAWLRLRHSEAIAARLALAGSRVYGPDLVAHGIANESVEDDRVLEAAHELASKFALHEPMGVRRIKTSLRRAGPADDATSWFQRVLDSDPMSGRRMTPVAATDS
ncbi:MAG: enoyl-CoA hydratase/isomerase family protein [Actinomycetia bacterium]|nr:enoyl-CoA hydratase/isomerase family protein [Actinomycetes bacterium]MCP4961789.1 enoyl-CoA hydratase/isomerase family protein [Actinomycetes bacterium]